MSGPFTTITVTEYYQLRDRIRKFSERKSSANETKGTSRAYAVPLLHGSHSDTPSRL